MSSLTAIFGSSRDASSGDTEKLLELYWNRAELKKEFASLRDETFRLQEAIKTEEGRTARIQQKYQHLEGLLLDPDWVHNVVVFYQLRALNQACKDNLATFAEKLKQQREQRQHSRMVEAWELKRREDAHAIERHIGELRMRVQLLEDQLDAERHRFSMMGGFMRFFRRRAVARTLEDISSEIGVLGKQEQALKDKYETVRSRQAPDTQGLSVGDKRSINLMVLSYIQQMYLHFADDNLAALMKEAGEKSVGAINYGNKSDCDYLLQVVTDRAGKVFDPIGYAEFLQQRARMLSESAKFRSDDDAVPRSSSVATLIEIDANGSLANEDVNLLGENYWDVAKVLSR